MYLGFFHLEGGGYQEFNRLFNIDIYSDYYIHVVSFKQFGLQGGGDMTTIFPRIVDTPSLVTIHVNKPYNTL